jgi:hypothetical protein
MIRASMTREGGMIRRVFVAGTLGFVVLTLWTVLVNVAFGFTARVAMNRVADERAVYRVLKANITAPGVYLVNPALTPERQFPAGEPVFGVSYSGTGHEAAGPMMPVEFGGALAAALLVAGLLSAASASVLSTWVRRTGFVVAVGVLLAISADLSRYGIGGWPLGSAAASATVRVAGWALAGLAMAWVMRPAAGPGGGVLA